MDFLKRLLNENDKTKNQTVSLNSSAEYDSGVEDDGTQGKKAVTPDKAVVEQVRTLFVIKQTSFLMKFLITRQTSAVRVLF